MNILDIVLGLMLAGLLSAMLLLKKSPDLRRQLSIVLSLAALGIVVYQAIQTPTVIPAVPGQESFDRHWATGWKLGQLLTEDLPEGGTVLVLQSTSDAPSQEKISAAQIEGLRSGLVSIGFDLVIRVAEGGNDLDLPDLSAHVLPPELLRTSIAKFTNLNAIVAFGRVPVDVLDPAALPPLYVTDPFGSKYWSAWVEQGHIRAAIAPREDSSPIDTSILSQDPGAVFDATFSVSRAAPSP